MRVSDDSKLRKNILPNTYTPVLQKKVLVNVLTRLPQKSLIQLALLWPKLIHTQPHIDESENQNQKTWNRRVLSEIKDSYVVAAGSAKKIPSKRKLIDKILYAYWSKGLNLLQLSQVDCQLVVDRSNSNLWILSTLKDKGGMGNDVPILVDPQGFLNLLSRDLSTLYLTYIYICRHPTYPLVIIRIQVFDLQPRHNSTNLKRPHILSYKPYFLAIPLNSPHILHTPGEDVISKIILQSIERVLLKDPSNIYRLVTNKNQKPVKSLEAMHILNGSSRFGSSLGVWIPYADGTVDSLPFASVEDHVLFKELEVTGKSGDDEMENLKKLANLRFKGTADGFLKSETLFDDVGPTKKRKKVSAVQYRRVQDDEMGEDEDEDSVPVSEYSSIAPVQNLDFIIADNIGNQEVQEESRISIRFSGNDIFAGLHELSVQTTDKEKMILNPVEVPGWLTGEEGAKTGTIRKGRLHV